MTAQTAPPGATKRTGQIFMAAMVFMVIIIFM